MIFQCVLRDEEGDATLGGITEVSVAIEYVVHRGDPGYRRDSNGDGCPPTPDEAVLVAWTVFGVRTAAGEFPRDSMTRDLFDRVKSWAANQISERWEEVEGWLLADAEESNA